MPLSTVVLLCVLVLIAIRHSLPVSLPIWLIMIGGAIVVLATQQISLSHAAYAIDYEIIFYLFGVFVIAEALERSGVLERFTEKIFNHSASGMVVLFLVVFLLGLGAALLMNDAIAILGTPIILRLCRENKQMATLLLITLAYAITIGSVLSPIGNPQNLLIAVDSGMRSPFVTFFAVLAIPTLINLVILYGVLAILYKKTLSQSVSKIVPIAIPCKRAAVASMIGFALFVLLVVIKIIVDLLQIDVTIDFTVIALAAAIPVVLVSSQRKDIIRHLDWGTLLFFVGMFVLMQSVWDSGLFQAGIDKTHFVVNHIPSILVISALVSQLISNVPMVALYMPLLQQVDVHICHYLALAAGSTLAGNIFVFGAASNMIIIQNAEKRGFKDFKVGLFSLIGIPLTAVNLVVYAWFIELLK